MALLPAKSFGLGHGDAFDADLMERLLHLVELEGLDDGFDLFHRRSISLRRAPVSRSGCSITRAKPSVRRGQSWSLPPLAGLPVNQAPRCLKISQLDAARAGSGAGSFSSSRR